jgi:2-succinyl-6-hydroxy-2,4-cyclohexadiene-1-carboxylate synthase
LVALHGFTHTGEQFASIADRLPYLVLAPDLPGHGATRISPIDVATVLEALQALLAQTGPAPLLGYSQGARIALLLALEHAALIESLTLVSASPGAADRSRRRAADDALARRIEHDGLDAFLDGWLASELTGTHHLPAAIRKADRAARMENTTAGLAGALRGYGQAAQPYVMDRLGKLSMPATFLAGSRDHRYAELARAMAAAATLGRAVVVEDAGHNLLLEAPDEVVRAVSRDP